MDRRGRRRSALSVRRVTVLEHGALDRDAAASNKPADDRSAVPPTVKLTPEATKVARRFIETAVARKNLPEAYTLVTETIRQGQSLAVVEHRQHRGHPVPGRRHQVRADEDRLLLSERGADRGRAARRRRARRSAAQLFQMDLVQRNGKWLVERLGPGRPTRPCRTARRTTAPAASPSLRAGDPR